MKQKICFLALLALLLSPVETIIAAGADDEEIITQSTTVFVSEIGWAGSSKSSLDEWLEISNFGDQEIDLSGWTIEGAATGGGSLTIPAANKIPPGKTYLIANYGSESTSSALAAPPNYINSGISLSNSSLHLVLKNREQNIVDEVGNGSAPFFGGTSSGGTVSMIRNWPITNGALSDSWSAAEISSGFDEEMNDLGTPGSWEIPPLPEEIFSEDEIEEKVEIEIIEELDGGTIVEGEIAPEISESAEEEFDESAIVESESESESEYEIDEGSEPSPTPPGAATPFPWGEGSDEIEGSLPETVDGDPPNTEVQTEISVSSEEANESTDIALNNEVQEVTTDTTESQEGSEPEEESSLQNNETVSDIESTVEEIEESSSATTTTTTSSSLIINYPYRTLIINEFVSDPISGEKEWVEIINPYNNVIPLAGWQISDASGKKATLPNILLGMGQMAVAEFSSGALNNNSDSILLLDPTGNTIDEIIYGQAEIPTTHDPNSVARDENGVFQVTETPTKGFTNLITKTEIPETKTETENPKETTTTSEVVTANSETETTEKTSVEVLSISEPPTLRLSELYPNTGGADATDEFIEIENFGKAAVDLYGIILKDAAGGSWSFETHQELVAGNFLVIKRSEFQFALNNSGSETVSLLTASGDLLDQIQYADAPKKFTFARQSELWRWTDIATPNESNRFPETLGGEGAELVQANFSPIDSGGVDSSEYVARVSIAEARSLEKNSRVIIAGVVSAAPGSLGNQIFYLTSGGAGIQVYKSDSDFPDLEIGDRVELSGTLSANRSEPRIKIGKDDSLTVLESAVPLAILEPDYFGPENGGLLVRLDGIVTEKSSTQFSVETETGIFDVKIKDGTEIKLTDIKPGDKIMVTGIVGQTDEKFYLLPRSQDDLQKEEIIETSTATTAGTSITTGKAAAEKSKQTKALIIGCLALLSLTVYAITNRQRRNRKPYEKIRQLSPAAAR